MERIVSKEVHRLVIVDTESRVQGVISLSDILSYIVLKQQEVATHLATQTMTTAFGQTKLTSDTTNGAKTTTNIEPIQSSSSSVLENAIFEDDPMETWLHTLHNTHSNI